MKALKRIATVLLFGATVLSTSIGAYANEITPVTDANTESFSIAPEVKAEYQADLSNTRSSILKEVSIPGGTWTGGNLDNGGWGTLISTATSTTKETNCFVKPGTFASYQWSGWEAKGKTSHARAEAAFSGNTCGYDIK